MILKAIGQAFEKAKERKWDRTYWAFDIHQTILEPNWSNDGIPTKFYPYALETLQYISNRPDIVMILYTCSPPHKIDLYQQLFQRHGIQFHYVNSNPEVTSNGFEYYGQKPYFNVLFDDKAGFDPLCDWKLVHDYFLAN